MMDIERWQKVADKLDRHAAALVNQHLAHNVVCPDEVLIKIVELGNAAADARKLANALRPPRIVGGPR